MVLVPRLPVNHTFPSKASGKILLQPGSQKYPSIISLALWALDTRLPIEGPAWVPLAPLESSTGLLCSVCSLPYWLELMNMLPSSSMFRRSPSPILLNTTSDLLNFVAQGLASATSSFLILPPQGCIALTTVDLGSVWLY